MQAHGPLIENWKRAVDAFRRATHGKKIKFKKLEFEKFVRDVLDALAQVEAGQSGGFAKAVKEGNTELYELQHLIRTEYDALDKKKNADWEEALAELKTAVETGTKHAGDIFNRIAHERDKAEKEKGAEEREERKKEALRAEASEKLVDHIELFHDDLLKHGKDLSSMLNELPAFQGKLDKVGADKWKAQGAITEYLNAPKRTDLLAKTNSKSLDDWAKQDEKLSLLMRAREEYNVMENRLREEMENQFRHAAAVIEKAQKEIAGLKVLLAKAEQQGLAGDQRCKNAKEAIEATEGTITAIKKDLEASALHKVES
jgi:hypothetical protein